ncbi:MAG: hypothetical protein ACLP8S_01280 [Solirubrobacteraceae bacterium]
MTRYLSRIGGSGAGAGIRPRVRSRFEPAPRAPIDGLGPAISIPTPAPDRDLDARAGEDDRSGAIAERQPPASAPPALDGAQLRGGAGAWDHAGPPDPTGDAALTARHNPAAVHPAPLPPAPLQPPTLQPPTDPGGSPQQRPQQRPRHAASQSNAAAHRPATGPEPATVNRALAGAPAETSRAYRNPPHAPRPEADADASPERRRAESAAPAPLARYASQPPDQRGSDSVQDRKPGSDHVSRPGSVIPGPSAASREDLSPPRPAVAAIPVQAGPRASPAARVPPPPRPGAGDGPALTHVTVSIDRVEVRAPASSAAAAPKPSARGPRRRPQSLEEYMRTSPDRRIG